MSWDDLSPEQWSRTSEALSKLRLELPAALEQRVREVAAQRGQSLSRAVREALEAWLDRPIP